MSESKQFFVYCITNRSNAVLYIGVTNNLQRRLYEHRQTTITSFVTRYNLSKLIYFEMYSCSYDAIQREKQLKGWKRSRKNELIASKNPYWVDLQETDFQFPAM